MTALWGVLRRPWALALVAMGGCNGLIGDAPPPLPGVPAPTSRPRPQPTTSPSPSPTVSPSPTATPSPTPTPSPTGPPYVPPRFACDASATPAELPLRRLSRPQYTNTLAALVQSTGLSPPDKAAVLEAIAEPLSRYPSDRLVPIPGEHHGGFERLDQAVQQEHVDVSYEVAVELGRAVVATDARRAALLGSCATDALTTNDVTCFDNFTRRIARRALRRPITDAELVILRTIAGTPPVSQGAIADVIGLLLTDPHFLYHVEEGDTAAAGPVALEAFALAARLSFHFWQTMPDDTLLDHAASGALLQDATYRAEVDRLFRDARTDPVIATFYGEWLRLEELPPLDARSGDPVFDAFAGADVPTADLHLDMRREVLDLAAYTVRRGGSTRDLVTSRKSFARSDLLARIYGQTRWDGTSEPADFVDPNRSGLITRAALLASGSANTRPIIKGFRIRNALLCQEIPPPPDNAMAMPIELSPDFTTREVVESITEQPNTACRVCHAALLNPLGFATESFDALGRHRTVQRLYEPDGRVRGEKPINTRAAPNLMGVTSSVAGAADVTRLLADSRQVDACFARQYFRFTFQRVEDLARDGCVLDALQAAAIDGKSAADLWMEIALRPEFKRRDFR